MCIGVCTNIHTYILTLTLTNLLARLSERQKTTFCILSNLCPIALLLIEGTEDAIWSSGETASTLGSPTQGRALLWVGPQCWTNPRGLTCARKAELGFLGLGTLPPTLAGLSFLICDERWHNWQSLRSSAVVLCFHCFKADKNLNNIPRSPRSHKRHETKNQAKCVITTFP